MEIGRLSAPLFGQIVEAEPWTAGSITAGIVVVVVVVGLVVWRVTRGHD